MSVTIPPDVNYCHATGRISDTPEGEPPVFRAITAEDRKRWAELEAQSPAAQLAAQMRAGTAKFVSATPEEAARVHAQRTALDQARELVAKRTAMAADMQPEKREPTVSELPALWHAKWHASRANGAALPDAITCATELSLALSREPNLTLSADAVQTLAGSRDLERRCAQLRREVEVYSRALAQIISVHALEEP